MENLEIFEKHFRRIMFNKDFNSFKRTHPTLLKAVLNAMDEVDKRERPMKTDDLNNSEHEKR
jgi:hypothetical protein